MGTLRDYARLIRLPNAPTACADILAGAVLIRAAFGSSPWPRPEPTLLLAGASACLYSAGMAFNDYADRLADAATRPDRPLPSGRVSSSGALLCGALLSFVGLLCACAAGFFTRDGAPWKWDAAPLVQAMVVLAAVLLYDFSIKRVYLLGPLTLGLCRGFNLQLGMTGCAEFAAHWNWNQAAGGELSRAVIWLAPLAACLYITGVTIFSTKEETGLPPRIIFRGWLWLIAAGAVGNEAVWVVGGGAGNWAWAAWGPLYALLLAATFRAAKMKTPETAKRLVLTGVAGICFIDAGWLLGAAGPKLGVAAACCAALSFPTLFAVSFRRKPVRMRDEA